MFIPIVVLIAAVIVIGMVAMRDRPGGERVKPLPSPPAALGHELRAMGAFARAEIPRLLRHPVVLVGVALSLWITVEMLQGAATADKVIGSVRGVALTPIGAALMVAGQIAASRERHTRSNQMTGAAAASERVRVIGLLLAVSAVAAIGMVLVVPGLAAYQPLGGVFEYEGVRSRLGVVDLTSTYVSLVSAGAIGVLIGTWFSHPIAAGLGVFTFFLSPVLWVAPILSMSPETSHIGDHLGFVAAVTAVCAAVGVLRRDRRPTVIVASVVALAGAVTFGTMQAAGIT